jgi:hypothetical protein
MVVLPVLAGMVAVAGTTALAPELERVTTLSVERVGVMVRVMESEVSCVSEMDVRVRVMTSSDWDCGVYTTTGLRLVLS